MVDFAKKYFNCPTIEGIPLENDGQAGTQGSHWEKLFVPNEYMNPTIENPGIISGFTGSVLQGTGWYTVKIILIFRYRKDLLNLLIGLEMMDVAIFRFLLVHLEENIALLLILTKVIAL